MLKEPLPVAACELQGCPASSPHLFSQQLLSLALIHKAGSEQLELC